MGCEASVAKEAVIDESSEAVDCKSSEDWSNAAIGSLKVYFCEFADPMSLALSFTRKEHSSSIKFFAVTY